MRIESTDGVTLELHDLGGEGPPLLIAHATGFCAGAYRPMLPTFTPHHHVWALDFRGHGASTMPASGDLSWAGMIDDVLAVVAAIGEGPVHGFGHSMGGACLLGAELRRPGTVRSAYVFEPIVIPSSWTEDPGQNPLAASARRRRASFPSRAEALARYASRPPLGTWRADALHAYVEDGFVDEPDGSITLACTPEHEAQVFEAGGKPRIGDLGPVAIPVVVAYGGRDGKMGPEGFAPAVADALPDGRGVQFPSLSHFGPFQDPQTIAEAAQAHFARN